ncbi:hypothetical protein HZ993_04000 [Rhodoferax sp. AJA081-3]|uniref:hypothetical protein n=1 Tax=Rhodoferax sp. AJA081-3 TaxID=2752316 RepID=UPI001ADFE9B8|nr:hypothetical protein [Rhodoferax sp. AJA081-3]QTN29017.1 hypothetical protein HZ993_04000 [Rhodoferax sp. AJA081-3]
MFAPRVVYAFLAMVAHGANAQPTPEAAEPTRAETREPARESDTQQRRALLRASLKSQPDVAFARANTSPVPRQMSDRERADLRQQLRQQ